ncbi:MAG: signal recognition particle receptor subunit alpha, partial [Gammaproteobacteria bacterium]|nr:signal recognition particle receptor subunit alpha [Gammaproteobacteria bacterium]
MFGFGKNKSGAAAEPQPPANDSGMFARLKNVLTRTRSSLTSGLANLVLGKKAIDAEVLEELETQLLLADVGVDATRSIVSDLTARAQRKQLDDVDALFAALHEDMQALLQPCAQPLRIDSTRTPFVILMVGVNGVGKTT